MPQKRKRGLANVDPKLRYQISVLGGQAMHPRGRGLQNAPEEIRRAISEKGARISAQKRRDKKIWAEIL